MSLPFTSICMQIIILFETPALLLSTSEIAALERGLFLLDIQPHWWESAVLLASVTTLNVLPSIHHIVWLTHLFLGAQIFNNHFYIQGLLCILVIWLSINEFNGWMSEWLKHRRQSRLPLCCSHVFFNNNQNYRDTEITARTAKWDADYLQGCKLMSLVFVPRMSEMH